MVLDRVLNIAGISNVVWVDDRFDPETISEIDLVALLAAACGLGAQPVHSLLAHLSGEADVDVWSAEVSNILAASERERSAAVAELRTLVKSDGGTVNDYTRSQIDALQGALDGARCLGFEAWKLQRDELKGTFGAGTLLLLDRQFFVGGKAENLGEFELSEIVNAKTGAMIVVLTHSVTPEGAEDLRYELAEKYHLPVSAFAVMAKDAEKHEAVALLAGSVRTVLTHRACEQLAMEVGQILSSSVGDAANEFLGQSLEELDRVIFGNSRDEGASEFEVVVRVLTLRARVLSEQRFYAELKRYALEIEKVRQLHEIARPVQHSKRALSALAQWHRDEVYDAGGRINPILLPLSSGDIFETDGKRYVVLAQACDLAVRDGGARALQEASFVRIKEKRSSEAFPARWHRIPAYLDGSDDWWLDYKESCVVALQYLEYAAMNGEGYVRLALSQSADPLLLRGWRVRFDNAITALRRRVQEAAAEKGQPNLKQAAQLALSDVLRSKRWGTLDLTKKELAFPFKRVARLRQPYAQAAWADLAAFQLRPAFPHDFAKSTVEDVASTAEAAPRGGDAEGQ